MAPSSPGRALLLACCLLPSAAAHAQDPSLVTGTVLDARTRTPLPRYALELRAGTRADRAVSDDKGRFRSSIAFPPGDVSIRLIDDESVERVPTEGGLELPLPSDTPLVVRFAGTPLELSVPAGPTFHLDWKPSDVEGAPTTAGTSGAWLVCIRPGEVDEGVLRKASVRIEADGRSWVRFGPLPSDAQGCAGSARLRVISADNKWMAVADVASAVDGPAQPVALGWRPCARWIGLLEDGQSHGVPGTWVELERLGEKGAVHERRRARCSVTGAYVFVALEPGRWRLRGDPLRFHPFESEPRDVAGGETAKLTVALDPERDLAPIQGRIEGVPQVEGQKAPLEAAIVVRRAGERLPQDSVRAGWRIEKGRYVAVFVVPNLPYAEYELELVPPSGDPGPWTATKLRAKPGSSVVFARR
jgi:hypothetical protein